jgi:hypothetical protein
MARHFSLKFVFERLTRRKTVILRQCYNLKENISTVSVMVIDQVKRKTYLQFAEIVICHISQFKKVYYNIFMKYDVSYKVLCFMNKRVIAGVQTNR